MKGHNKISRVGEVVAAYSKWINSETFWLIQGRAPRNKRKAKTLRTLTKFRP